MVYETTRMIADLLESSGLFKQVFIHGGTVAKAVTEIVREPGVAVVYVGEEGSLAGGFVRRDLVFAVVLKTITLGRGDAVMKNAGDVLDGVFNTLKMLPLASWKVSDIGSGGRESLYRIDFTYRAKG